ncbi:MAG: hypothetical protein ISS16_06390 [Ignavibacteria bacterium]|nr:hypothetical protein [Ignavibacteria bacterium]
MNIVIICISIVIICANIVIICTNIIVIITTITTIIVIIVTILIYIATILIHIAAICVNIIPIFAYERINNAMNNSLEMIVLANQSVPNVFPSLLSHACSRQRGNFSIVFDYPAVYGRDERTT